MADIIEKKRATLEEARTILEERVKEGEITFEQQTALDYAKKFSKLDSELSKKMEDELAEIIEDGESRKKLVDLLPKTVELIKIVLQKNEVSISADSLSKVLEICKNYRKLARQPI